MKHNVGTLLGVVGVTTAATLLGVGEASAIVLDNFSADHDVLAGNTDTISDSGIFGGAREVDMTEANENSHTLAGDAQGNDRLVFQVDDSVNTAQTLTLRYDGGSAPATSLNENGILPPTDFGKGVLFTDVSGTATIDVLLFSGTNNDATAASSFIFTRTDPEDVFLSFNSNFTLSGGFDSTAVTAAQFSITENDQGNTNPRIRSFETVPEAVPFEAETSAGLLLLGTWGFWKYWKKRNQPKVQLTASDQN